MCACVVYVTLYVYPTFVGQFSKSYISNCIIRRNNPGDKDKALAVMDELLKQQENQVPDFLCLCGRIYKDKFVEFDYSDNESREKAIHWWVILIVAHHIV